VNPHAVVKVNPRRKKAIIDLIVAGSV